MPEDEPPDVVELAYDRADELRRAGDPVAAGACESIGRMWYLIGKKRLGVTLSDDEQADWDEFIAKHGPNATR